MKKCFFYLLFCLGLLCSSSADAWNNTDPANPVPLETNCNLPAPTGIAAYQPNPYTVTFTWNAVPGAIGYRASLYVVGASTGTTNYPVGPSTSFSANPGDTCVFLVSAKCANGEYSDSTASMGYRLDYVIVEIVVARDGCTPYNKLFEGGPNSVFSSPEMPLGNVYIAELSKNNVSQYFQFQYKQLSNNSMGFEFKGFKTNSAMLFGQDPNSPIYIPAPNNPGNSVFASNLMVSKPGNPMTIGHFAFPTSSEISYYNSSNETPFPIFRIWAGCYGGGINGGGGASGNNRAGHPDLSNEMEARQLLDNIRPANPFSDQLPLIFLESPEQALTARIFDASGRRFLQQRIAPEEVSENYYALPTATLPPGFYFLQVEAAPGVMETWKVVKW